MANKDMGNINNNNNNNNNLLLLFLWVKKLWAKMLLPSYLPGEYFFQTLPSKISKL
jgi:hypothetical protein